MKIKRIIAALLLSFILVIALPSCDCGGTADGDTTTTSGQNEPTKPWEGEFTTPIIPLE